MNLFDIIILVVLSFFALKGLLRGLVNEASSLAGLVLGGWLAYRYYPTLSTPLKNILHIPEHIAAFLAFMLLLMLSGLVAHILGNIITTALRVVMLGSLNRLGGVVIGVAEGALLLSMLFCIGTADFMPLKLKQKIRLTESANMFAKIGDTILVTWRGRPANKP
ncbi:MAG: CvpA family protein [Desulfuromonadales bacterium]|nr:CvpA family protein [Desulfuromonadales bacterium]